MRVLLIEDDENKITQLTQFLSESMPGVEVSTSRSLRNGIFQLRTASPELIILDMTLPNYDIGPDEPGGQMHPLGGRELLRQMDRFEIEIPVIVVTQFERFGKGPDAMNLEDLDLALQHDHGRVYRGLVYYHAAIHGWQQELESLVKRVAEEIGGEHGQDTRR